MRIGIIGRGAIASFVSNAVAAHPTWQEVARLTRTGPVTRVAELPDLDVLVDCAGHSGLTQHAPPALAAGIDVLTLSLGALAEAGLAEDLRASAQRGGARLHLASGAIGALDALRAARVGGLDEVIYTGTKPPAGWRGSPAEDVLDLDRLDQAAPHYSGTARDAALRYPKNANVAAAVALSGIGFDETKVALVADPTAPGNTHRISAKGAFGTLDFTVTGAGLPDNPRSSALAAMSALAALDGLSTPITFA